MSLNAPATSSRAACELSRAIAALNTDTPFFLRSTSIVESPMHATPPSRRTWSVHCVFQGTGHWSHRHAARMNPIFVAGLLASMCAGASALGAEKKPTDSKPTEKKPTDSKPVEKSSQTSRFPVRPSVRFAFLNQPRRRK